MGKDAEMEVNGAADEQAALKHLLGQKVIIDTPWPLLYIGLLEEWGEHFVTLADVDVHDISQGTSSKDTYANVARKHGVQLNRRKAIIRKSQVVSLSALEDVIAY